MSKIKTGARPHHFEQSMSANQALMAQKHQFQRIHLKWFNISQLYLVLGCWWSADLNRVWVAFLYSYQDMFKQLIVTVAVLTIASAAVGGSSSGQNCPSGSSWDGNKCACPPNMINLNGKCFCDYGFSLSNDYCQKCDSSSSSSCYGSSSSCPSGQTWNGNSCSFSWKVNNCPKGQYWNGLYCKRISYPVTCEPGFSWNGKACSIISVPVCTAGNYYNGQACKPFVNPPICLNGFYWDILSTSCVKRQRQSCGGNSYWNGIFCSNRTANAPKCAPGSYWNGQSCDFISSTWTPRCTSGHFWAGRTCKPTNNKICDKGFHQDPFSSSCTIQLCPKGQVLANTGTTCITTTRDGTVNIVSTAPGGGAGTSVSIGPGQGNVKVNNGIDNVNMVNGNVQVNRPDGPAGISSSGRIILANGTVVGGNGNGNGNYGAGSSAGGLAVATAGSAALAAPGGIAVNGLARSGDLQVRPGNGNGSGQGGVAVGLGGVSVSGGGNGPRVGGAAPLNLASSFNMGADWPFGSTGSTADSINFAKKLQSGNKIGN